MSADSVGPFIRKDSPGRHHDPGIRPAWFAGNAPHSAFQGRKLPGGGSEAYPQAPAVHIIRGRSAGVQAPRQRSASPKEDRIPGISRAPSDPRRSLGTN